MHWQQRAVKKPVPPFAHAGDGCTIDGAIIMGCSFYENERLSSRLQVGVFHAGQAKPSKTALRTRGAHAALPHAC